ncbi:MAG: membrane protein insertase YidC [Rikenellaceae bacterium]|jgi:YidC/Oxa1 family membrane protein insertase|nr:membrane protein insertase YidC [Rikenellaceae bacterium]
MDKNTITGLIVIGAILFGFSWYSSRQQKQAMAEKQRADSIYRANNPEPAALDSTIMAANVELQEARAAVQAARADSVMEGQLGPMLFAAQKGTEEFFTLENEKIRVTLSTRGGRVAAVELKEYKRYGGAPLMLFDEHSSKFDMGLLVRNVYSEVPVNTAQYYFAAEKTGDNALAMKLMVDSTACVQYTYTLVPDDYTVAFVASFPGMERLMNSQSLSLEWESAGFHNEKGFDNENRYCDIVYKYPGTTDVEKLGFGKNSKDKQETAQIKWLAFKQQFFSTIIMADDSFAGASMRYDSYQPGGGMMKKYNARFALPYDPAQGEYGMSYYFGPNKYSTLKTYGESFEKLVPLGWGIFGWVNRWMVIPVFDWLSGSIASFGIIILILTILIKIVISPLTYKSYLSSAKMRLLKPEMDELAKKYPDQKDMAKKQQATMELYKKAGVNPMGGCLPMLIQMPILIAMFQFFPAAIELRGQSFLWADDLSSYDSIFNFPGGFSIPFYGDHISLFALLMAVSVYFYSRINSAQLSAAGPQMAGMKFMSLYLMPVMMLLWFNNYAAGLSYYYFLSNLISMGQTWGFRYIVNDEKLHARMKANAKKPVKKSKWTERYEQVLKEQQRQQREQAAARSQTGKQPAKKKK